MFPFYLLIFRNEVLKYFIILYDLLKKKYIVFVSSNILKVSTCVTLNTGMYIEVIEHSI